MPNARPLIPGIAKASPVVPRKWTLDRVILLLPAVISVAILCAWAMVSLLAFGHETGRNRAQVAVDSYIATAQRSYEDSGAIGLTTFLDQISTTQNQPTAPLSGKATTFVAMYRENGTVVFANIVMRQSDITALGKWVPLSVTTAPKAGENSSGRILAIGKRVDIEGKYYVFIAQSYVAPNAALSKYSGFLLMAAVLAMLLIAAIFAWSQRQYMARISTLTETLLRVANGEHGIRIPVTPSNLGNWELDSLSLRINNTLDRIESTTGAIRDWTAQAAHELRAHLTLVADKIKVLEGSHPEAQNSENKVQESALDTINDTLSLFDALLELVAIRTDVDQRVGPVDIGHIFKTAQDLYGMTAEETGVSMVFTHSGPKLLAEQWLIMRAILNLIENALKFAPPDSKIDISWEYAPDGAVLRVRDRGQGPLGATLQQMMQRTKTSIDDTGHRIGLRTVEAIAVRHGAKVDIEDAQPGLCVYIFFPTERLIAE